MSSRCLTHQADGRFPALSIALLGVTESCYRKGFNTAQCAAAIVEISLQESSGYAGCTRWAEYITPPGGVEEWEGYTATHESKKK